MALEKLITLDTGYTGNYWRIASVLHVRDGETTIVLGCYKDKVAFEAGWRPIAVETHTVNLPTDQVLDENFLKLAYDKIREATPDKDEYGGKVSPEEWFAEIKDA